MDARNLIPITVQFSKTYFLERRKGRILYHPIKYLNKLGCLPQSQKENILNRKQTKPQKLATKTK